ncbi:MAG: PaaI family thioesterase [Chloroflexi bacterium]|nr:PaaI family thioesterase [Chloroflexota bacterium]
MPKKFPLNAEGFHPFAELIGLKFSTSKKGYSECVLEINEKLLNPHKVVHGGVIYSMADTGMGAALYPLLDEDDLCATVEIKIAYFAAIASGILVCKTKVIHKGKRIAVLESEIESNGRLTAKAIGTYSIFKAKGD